MSSSTLLDRWLSAVVATPGLTALEGDEARRVLLDDSLAGVPLVSALDGPIVDVGSGGGAPGIPLAASLPDREVTLLEAQGKKAEFVRGARSSRDTADTTAPACLRTATRVSGTTTGASTSSGRRHSKPTLAATSQAPSGSRAES